MDKIEELLTLKGLYDGIEISIENLREMEKYLSKSEYTDNTIDCFCIECGEKRIFEYFKSEIQHQNKTAMVNLDLMKERKKPTKDERYNEYLNKRYTLAYFCTRNKEHSILFDLITTDDKLIKIGQFPSIASLLEPEIRKYKSVLGEHYIEFSKAIGLYAHGIGVGSFVYLRRIIEILIYEKYEENSSRISMDSEEFNTMKFSEKIEMLGEYLPQALVDNKNLYGIISKGIHELDEKECLTMFPNVQIGIELILDDILAEKERTKKEKALQKFVSDKTGELRNK